ncbi:sel1 repeat family protein [Acidovorax sp. FHTAMBA]|uniref:sel1 repeat family protein n=1 Tax=Acidovorax sp. FHTAMBA TaxID=3140252 RepID=UPI003182D7D9
MTALLALHGAVIAQVQAPPPTPAGVSAQAPAVTQAQAQSPTPAQAQAPAQAGAPAAGVGARFIESCNEALQRGVAELGCQGPIYRNELERLKREALNTQNPQLLSFVGDAYQNPRSGLGDMGQAYRWYLLAAVRGDPRAMQRLTEMNRKGQGVPKDNVKALGYARLLERMAQPDSGERPNVLSLINELGAEMAVEEVALAERFAAELEARIQRQAAGSGGDAAAQAAPAAGPSRAGGDLPGMSGVPRSVPGAMGAPAAGAAVPGTTLPGTPSKVTP